MTEPKGPVILLALIAGFSIFVDENTALSNIQKIQISGTVISYNLFSGLTLIVGVRPKTIEDHDLLIVRIDRPAGDLKKGQYIKLRFTNSENPDVHLPKTMLKRAQQWQFVLTRDDSCDQSAESVIYTQGKHGQELNKSWERLRGAEKEKIPEDVNLPCYAFGVSDFRK